MASLILTEKEKSTESFLDWDDAALGKLVKFYAKRMADDLGDRSALVHAACIHLCEEMERNRALSMEISMENVLANDRPVGNFKVAANWEPPFLATER